MNWFGDTELLTPAYSIDKATFKLLSDEYFLSDNYLGS